MIALEPGQQWLSQFRLLKELAPATDKRPLVWLAEKHGANAQVVLKFLRAGPPSPLLVRRLADWRATRVPQFMPLLGVHTAGDQITLELPYVPEDNAALRGAPYPKWSVWLEQVVETLQELHRENFVHGDLKLGNLRREAGGLPMLADPWLPGDGRSPYTASPERLNGGPISVQDDLYALGALMHELATGYPPGYPGVAGGRPSRANIDMPAEARDLMQALLSANPARRPPLNEVIDKLVPLNSTHPQAEVGGAGASVSPAAAASAAAHSVPAATSAAPTQMSHIAAPASASTAALASTTAPFSTAASASASSAPAAARPALRAAVFRPSMDDDDAPRTVILPSAGSSRQTPRIPPPAAAAPSPLSAAPPPLAATPPRVVVVPPPITAAPQETAAAASTVPPLSALSSQGAAPLTAEPVMKIEAGVLPHEPTIILRTSPPPELLATETPFEPVPLSVEPPAWKHPAGPGVNSGSPFQSRASVWRWPLLLILLGGAIAAFVWLPDEMRQSAVEQVAAVASRVGLIQGPAAPSATSPAIPSAAPSATPSAAPSASSASVPKPEELKNLAEQKLAAEQVRDQAQSLEGKLRDDGAAARSIPSFVAGGEALQQGLGAFDRRDFASASADFESALHSFQATQQALPDLHRRALADGDAALAQCLPAQALSEYRYALALMPNDAAAKLGIDRAQVCEQVFAHVSAGAKAEQGGDTATARREYQAALQLDPKSSAAHDALARLNGQADDSQFSRQLAAALEGLRSKRYSAAATALAAAERLHPDNADVQRLNLQLSEVRATERLQALKAEAAQDERNEQWSEALEAYRAMLAVDGTLALGVEGAKRSQDRMQLDAELAGYIEHPERLSSSEVREAADAALSRARILTDRGPRIETQISRVGVLLGQYESMVQVSLRSDGITDVTIYRVGALGRFAQRSVSLRPGKYTIVGSRLGYRDVRRELEVAPGEKDVVLEIRCEEQI